MIAAWIAVAQAAQVSIQAERSELIEGQTVGLQVVVTDASMQSVPEIPVPEGLSLRYRTQSVQNFFVNFQSSTSVIFSYELAALKAGNYTIGPLNLQTGAGPLSTTALKLSVLPRQAQGALDRVEGSIESAKAWIGQILVYHLRFQTERNIVNGRWSPPEAIGFSTVSLQEEQDEISLTQDGKNIKLYELYYPLRASTVGKRTLPGGVLQAQFALPRSRARQPFFGLDRFGDVQAEVFSSDAIPVEVLPLPTVGRPADFNNLVGHFSILAKTSSTQVAVGDTVTVEVQVEGNAPLDGVQLSPLVGNGFRVYDDRPSFEAALKEGKVVASAVFKRAVVPQEPGEIQIPASTLSFFDPSTGSYQTISSQPLVLQVSGAASTAQVASFSQTQAHPVDAQGEDILPLRPTASLSTAWKGEGAWFLALPGTVLLALEALQRLRPKKVQKEDEFKPDFSSLPSEPEARLQALDLILRTAIARRLKLRVGELQREQLAGLGEHAAVAEELYRLIEVARYRGDSGAAIEQRVRKLVEELR